MVCPICGWFPIHSIHCQAKPFLNPHLHPSEQNWNVRTFFRGCGRPLSMILKLCSFPYICSYYFILTVRFFLHSFFIDSNTQGPFSPLVMNCFLTQFFTLQIENEIRILPPNLEPSFYFVTLWSREFISYN